MKSEATYSNRTPWSETIGLKLHSLKESLDNPVESIERARQLSNEGMLLNHWGARSIPWRIFLGLLYMSESGSSLDDTTDTSQSDSLALKVQWVRQTKEQRAQYLQLQQSLSIKAMIANS